MDFILIETVFDTLNAKAAIVAADEAAEARDEELPVMVSMTLTDLAQSAGLAPSTPPASTQASALASHPSQRATAPSASASLPAHTSLDPVGVSTRRARTA